jgi:hypothetical protein
MLKNLYRIGVLTLNLASLVFLFFSLPLAGPSFAQNPSPKLSKNGPLVVFMGPNGSDQNDGLTLNTPILTLNRAQDVLRDQLRNHHRSVEIRIGSGTYRNQTVRWTFTMPAHTTTFMPLLDDKNRPVFDGSSTKDATWFRLGHADGQKTNLVFHYIRVENYSTAIDFHGNRDSTQGFNSSNRIFGSYFFNIGKGSTAAVRLVHSKNNEIINNHFVDVLRSGGCGLLHALYLAHMSSRNQILRNRFENSCGDPIRIRDYSNDNIINENNLTRVGVNAAYTDWYCDHDTRPVCTSADTPPGCCGKPTPECPSWNNQFRENVLDKNFAGERLRVFRLFQDDEAKGCRKPTPNSERLRTSGNVHK